MSRNSLTLSSNMQCPFLAHVLHAVQPASGFMPIQKISVSIPSFLRVFATSERAIHVQPFLCGLPFTSKTFIFITPDDSDSTSCFDPSVYCRAVPPAL